MTNPITICILLISLFLESCNQNSTQLQQEDMNNKEVKSSLSRPLQIGDKIELTGGYDYDPLYLKSPPSSKRSGVIVQFIEGQNEEPAAVVKLDEEISGQKITGDIIILELRHVGQTWQEPTPVHIELCDFMPENKTWKERKQGEWIEAAAIVKLIK